jgi:hypothetical protein
MGALALLGAAPATANRAPTLRACRAVRVTGGEASHVRTTYGCRYARKTLTALLYDGTFGLPRRRPTRNRWGCAHTGKAWRCSRKRAHGRRGRILFRFARLKEQGDQAPPKPPPVPVNPLQRCVDLWNSDSVNVATIGYHLAYHHQVTRVWIFDVAAGVGAAARCAVIAVVPETDLEFGNDGEVSLPQGGWALMATVPELGDPKDVQRRAGANANASLLPSGQLALP